MRRGGQKRRVDATGVRDHQAVQLLEARFEGAQLRFCFGQARLAAGRGRGPHLFRLCARRHGSDYTVLRIFELRRCARAAS